ncbi:MAG: radical SAM family heme chaperone HemW [Pseudomonadota bacterium]
MLLKNLSNTSTHMPDLFGIYVHWPFCQSKCPYCDFNSHVSDTIDQAQWREAYSKEIAYTASLTKGRKVTSIFFGGGTPSLMEPETVHFILNDIAKYWQVAEDCEITLEANPTSIEAHKFKDFKAAGVNRVSIGVQALNDYDLKFLERQHNADEALNALKIADQIFDRFSFDLIYARPEQSVEAWQKELKEALHYAKGHLSLYQLTIEQGTPFYMRHKRGDFFIPEETLAADLYEATQEMIEEANMPAYEVSNHALKGQESEHNLTYWRYADYAGIGPGAHGRLTLEGAKNATRTHRAPDIWIEKTKNQGHGYHDFEKLDYQDRLQECVMMGLRLREGISIQKIEKESGQSFSQAINQGKVKALTNEGLLELTATHIKPTKAGLQRVNALAAYFL